MLFVVLTREVASGVSGVFWCWNPPKRRRQLADKATQWAIDLEECMACRAATQKDHIFGGRHQIGHRIHR